MSISGKVSIILGPMFSGKTTELNRRLTRYELAQKKVFRIRYKNDTVQTTHDGVKKKGEKTFKLSELKTQLIKFDIIGIDEAQFFDIEITQIIQRMADEGLRVIVAGLDTDFRGEPFGPMPTLMAQAERVDKLHAICMECAEEASRTQRLLNGKPAHYDDPVVVIGASELYEARCRKHHEVPRD